jgi:hypothetical protein
LKNVVQSSSVMSKKSFGSKMPALLTRISIAGTAAASCSHPSAVETSAAMPRTFAFVMAAFSADAALSALVCVRPLTTTSAPDCASPLAMAKPIPLVEPLTSAVFPERSMFMRRALEILPGRYRSGATTTQRDARRRDPQTKRAVPRTALL